MKNKKAVLLLACAAVALIAFIGMTLANLALRRSRDAAVDNPEIAALSALPAEQTPEPTPKRHPFEQSLKLLCLNKRDRSFTERGGAAFERYWYEDNPAGFDPVERAKEELRAWADCGMVLDEDVALRSVNTFGLYPAGGDSMADSIIYDAVIADTARGFFYASCDTETGKILGFSQRHAASPGQHENPEDIAQAFSDYLGLGPIELVGSGSPNVFEYYDYYCPGYDMIITISYSGLFEVEAYPMSLYERK